MLWVRSDVSDLINPQRSALKLVFPSNMNISVNSNFHCLLEWQLFLNMEITDATITKSDRQ